MGLSRVVVGGGPSSDIGSEATEGLMEEGRLLERRTVMEEGSAEPAPARGELRGELRGVVLRPGGSLERAECTRSSIFCMRLRRLFIWLRDSERGMPSDRKLGRDLGGFMDLESVAVELLLGASDGFLLCRDA